MLPGSDFGLQPTEMVSRMAYVDFNGKEALEAAAGADKKLNGGFIEACCPRVAEGTRVLIEWLKGL